MADLNHWWGDDLNLTPSGDLATLSGIDKDNQRIVRRLCTNGSQSGARLAEYWFHPPYGGSAPWYIGQTTDKLTMQGVIRSQMYQEASVSHDPEPTISPNFTPGGTFSAEIQYTNNETGLAVPPLVLEVSL